MDDKQTPKTASPRRKYDDAFRQQALQMVANGQAVRSVALNLGISENLLHTWKQKQQTAPHHLEAENHELRVRLKQAETERDILKKALSICARRT
jgi:transposase